MKTICLKRYYPHLGKQPPLNVSDEIAVTLSIGGRLGTSFQRRKREHGECSLDTDSGFEPDVTRPPLSPEEVMVGREDHAALYAALAQLPPVQARRVYAHYILESSKAEIARAEGVDERNVRSSIQKGLRNLEKILKNLL